MIVTPAVGRIQTHDIPLRGLLIINATDAMLRKIDLLERAGFQ
jgi:hypothetical protein